MFIHADTTQTRRRHDADTTQTRRRHDADTAAPNILPMDGGGREMRRKRVLAGAAVGPSVRSHAHTGRARGAWWIDVVGGWGVVCGLGHAHAMHSSSPAGMSRSACSVCLPNIGFHAV